MSFDAIAPAYPIWVVVSILECLLNLIDSPVAGWLDFWETLEKEHAWHFFWEGLGA